MLDRLIAEASRRRVFRGAATYVMVAWIAVHLVELLTDPTNSLRRLAFLLSFGLFPFALLFSWVFQVTPGHVDQEHKGAAAPPQTALSRMFDLAAVLGIVGIIAFELVRATLVRF